MLKVENLNIGFNMYDSLFNQHIKKTIFDMNIEVKAGEIHAVVGSSGSGKSLLAHAILDILPENAVIDGKIYYKNELLTKKNIEKYRGKEITLIPQSVSYLDPLMKTNKQIFGKKCDTKKQKELFETFNLKVEDGEKFPFQLSGGMARRAMIMTSIISDGELIVADEPTPGLSPKLAIETLNILKTMAKKGKAILLITHDIDLICEVADRISIFYGGTILETLNVSDFMSGNDKIKHPYTKALWSCLPQNNFEFVDIDAIKKICKDGGYILPE